MAKEKKIPVSYTISANAKQLLEKLAIKHKRSMATMLEIIIEQACEAEKITLE